MEELTLKYAFTYGPLMIFFLAVGWGVKTYAPPLFAAWQAMLKETVSALQSASTALNNSTRAIEANNYAMSQHHETVLVMNRFFDDMKDRLENFQCPATPKPSRRRLSASAGSSKKSTKVSIL